MGSPQPGQPRFGDTRSVPALGPVFQSVNRAFAKYQDIGGLLKPGIAGMAPEANTLGIGSACNIRPWKPFS